MSKRRFLDNEDEFKALSKGRKNKILKLEEELKATQQKVYELLIQIGSEGQFPNPKTQSEK